MSLFVLVTNVSLSDSIFCSQLHSSALTQANIIRQVDERLANVRVCVMCVLV